MPNRHLARLLAAATLPLLLAGCLPAHVPLLSGVEERPLEIVGVDAPADARAGAPVTVTLRARLYGRGWRVGEAIATVDGRARTVTLGGTARPDPAVPDAADAGVREEALTVTFTPKAAGTYRFEVPHGIARARLERTIRVLE